MVGAIDADVRRTVCLSWRVLVQPFSLLQADGEAEVLCCIEEMAYDVLYFFLGGGEKRAVVSKQHLSDEFLGGFRSCEETPKVEQTAVCSETDVCAVWHLRCLVHS